MHCLLTELLEVGQDLEAALVLDLSLSAMVIIMADRLTQCVDLLLKFITTELEEDWLAQVRLHSETPTVLDFVRCPKLRSCSHPTGDLPSRAHPALLKLVNV